MQISKTNFSTNSQKQNNQNFGSGLEMPEYRVLKKKFGPETAKEVDGFRKELEDLAKYLYLKIIPKRGWFNNFGANRVKFRIQDSSIEPFSPSQSRIVNGIRHFIYDLRTRFKPHVSGSICPLDENFTAKFPAEIRKQARMFQRYKDG